MINIFSFFSGFGFLDLGFEKAGYKINYVNEIHKPFIYGYRNSRRYLDFSEPYYGYQNISIEDVFWGNNKIKLQTAINTLKNNELIGFIGGPPCPDFSVGGKNKGKEGENGRLSSSYIELISAFRPHFFLFENVKGLWRTKKHRKFFEELKLRLISEGYFLSESLVNAIEFGVPQDRERILLFGVHKSIINKNDYEFNYITNHILDFPWKTYAIHPERRAFKYNWPDLDVFKIDSSLDQPLNIPAELTVQHWFEKNNVEEHENSHLFFKPRAGLEKFKSIPEGDVSKKSYKRLHRWRYSPTAAYGNNEVHLHPYKARRISASEALSIQSLPKYFQLPVDLSLTNIFKGIGNGVPYLLSYSIAKTIQDFFGELNGTYCKESSTCYQQIKERCSL